MIDAIRLFFNTPHADLGAISNEIGLQLELGYFLRSAGYQVEFERAFAVTPSPNSTKKPKRELDLLVSKAGKKFGIELKVPLAGRVPETMYDFCADIEFVETLVRHEHVHEGACILVTNNTQFWRSPTDSGGIYRFFRSDQPLKGFVIKPTGARDSQVVISGQYYPGRCWSDLKNQQLVPGGRYLLVEVGSSVFT